MVMPSGRRFPLAVVSLGGSVAADRVHRREIQMTFTSPDGSPLPREVTSRRGQRVVARKVIEGPSGREFVRSLGSCRVTRVSRDGDGPWSLTAKSDEYVLARSGFLRTRAMPSMASVDAIRALVSEVFPDARVAVLPGVRNVRCSPKEYDADEASRWRAIEDYALVSGAELYCPPGGGFQLGPIPTADAPHVWTVEHGSSLVSRSVSWDEDAYANAVRVEDRESGSVGIAADLVPSSSTYVGDAGTRVITGRVGVSGSEGYRLITEFLDLPAGDDVAAREAAQSRRAQLKARAGGVTFAAIGNPWLDVGNVVRMTHPDGVSKHVITGLPISGTDPGAVTPDTSG